MTDEAGDAHPDLPAPEVLAGQAIRRLREERGWSQQEVANRMMAHGFSWLQSTVGKTEAAQRPLRVNELVTLALLFETSPVNILQPVARHRDEVRDLKDREMVLKGMKARRTVEEEKLTLLQRALEAAARAHRLAQLEYDSHFGQLRELEAQIAVWEKMLAQGKQALGQRAGEGHD